MNIMEYILKERKLQGMSSLEFAEKMPFTRQRAEGIIASGDARFAVVRLMLNAIEKDVGIIGAEARSPLEGIEEILDALADSDIYYSKAEKLMESMGMRLLVVEKSEKEA